MTVASKKQSIGKSKTGRIVLDSGFYLLGSVLYALSVNIFSAPNQIAPGGVTGVATLLNYAFHRPTGAMILAGTGKVWARTWRELEASIPLTAQVKEYTGRERTLWSAEILWGTLEFYGNSSISYEKYDKIAQDHTLTLFGRALPFGIRQVTCREYTLTEQEVDADAARAMLEEELLRQLDAILAGSQGQVLRTDFTARQSGGLLTVTMLAECQEQIGVTVEREGETGRVYGENTAGDEAGQ